MIVLSKASLSSPLLVEGDAFALLKQLPDHSIDVIITSPPYFGHREICQGPFKQAKTLADYLRILKRFGKECRRVLKQTGSLWLNIGDTYRSQSLLLVPSRVAIAFQDELGFTLRNDIIWEKRKFLPPSIKNRTAQSYEHLFHFVLDTEYYVNKTVGTRATQYVERGGRVVSKTGITGEDYRKKIKSSSLSETEKANALAALEEELEKISSNAISDFRMLLRDGTSIIHHQRRDELMKNGFAFIEASPVYRVGDVWNIGVSNEAEHDAAFPEELVIYPILSSTPKSGIVLDPFMGSGTTLVAAIKLHRRSIGFEIDHEYYELAKRNIG